MIIRTHKNNNFTVIDNAGLRDVKLSWKAKGILAYLLSLPDNWKVYVSELINHTKDGRDSTQAGIKELIKRGYIKRERLRDHSGKFIGYKYDIYESGIDPVVDSPFTENPFTENPKLLNTNNTKEKKIKESFSKEKESTFKQSLKSANDSLNNFCLTNHWKKILKKSSRIKKEKYFNEKEINKSKKTIKEFLKGNLKEPLKAFIEDQFSKEYDTLVSGITEKKFKEMFELSLKAYDKEFFPVSKQNLPNRLSTFLYNPYAKIKSQFLFYALNGVKEITGSLSEVQDKYPRIAEKYEKFFEYRITKEEEMGIRKMVNLIVQEHQDIINEKVVIGNKRVKRCDIESMAFLSHIFPLTEFITEHLDFLYSFKYDENFTKSIGQMKVGGWFWRNFESYLNRKYGVKMYVKKEQLERKARLFEKAEIKRKKTV